MFQATRTDEDQRVVEQLAKKFGVDLNDPEVAGESATFASIEAAASQIGKAVTRHITQDLALRQPNFSTSQPGKCARTYRVVVVRKDIAVTKGQQPLFNDTPYLFYLTNASPQESSARQVVFAANDRCDQENTIGHMKACGALAAPLDNLQSNWVYMVIASLAWSLKISSGLMIQPRGAARQKQAEAETNRRVIRMSFQTFCQSLIQIPAQNIRGARQLIYRLLSYRPSLEPLLLIHENLRRMAWT